MTDTLPLPADALRNFEVRNDELCLNGVSVSLLAARAGATPFYAYDRRALDARVALLRTSLPAEAQLHYAMKANPMPAVVQHLARQVDGIDVASAGEMISALDTGMHAEHISFAGPGKTPAELTRAIAAGVVINVESVSELERAIAIGRSLARRPKIAFRVNPPFELKGAGMRMGGSAKPFGIDAEDVPAICRDLRAEDADWHGLHVFAGSQCLSAKALTETQDLTLGLACRIAAEAGREPALVNIGGGFGIPYFPGDRPLDIEAVGRDLRPLLERTRQALPRTRIAIELGRYLVGEAGVYVCRVIERKVSRGETFLVTDGGLHHHLSASGNFGQVLRKNYPLVVANRVRGSQRERVNVVGPLCTPLDVLGAQIDVARADSGDLIAVLQSGAYGLSASPTGFLGHPRPIEMLV